MMNNTMPVRQRGIVLFVALIMLVVMSILGISSIRGIALEEKMSGISYDQSLAFQAAEAALRAGEQAAISLAAGSEPAEIPCAPLAAAQSGYIPTPSINCSPNWVVDPNIVPDISTLLAAATPLTTNLGPLAGNAPRYLIEYLGGDAPCYPGLNPDKKYDSCAAAEQDCSCHRFRVTAISNPGEGRANVMLQSVFFTR